MILMKQKKQKIKIQEIDANILKIQQNIAKIDKPSVVVKRNTITRPRSTNKPGIEEDIKQLQKKISDKELETKNQIPIVKKAQEVVGEKRLAVNKLKTGVFYTKLDSKFYKINDERLQETIKTLESRLETETLSIAEEKIVVQDIKKTKAMKNNFAPYEKRANELKDAEIAFNREDRELKKKQEMVDEWTKQISELKNDLLHLEEKEKETKKQQEQEKKQQENEKQKVTSERTTLENKLSDLLKELNQEKENLRINRDKWYESKRQDRNKKMDEFNNDRAEKRKEIEKEEKEKKLQTRLERKLTVPFEPEIAILQNLVTYLSEILSSNKVNEEKKDDENKQTEKKEEEEKKEEKKKKNRKMLVTSKERSMKIFSFQKNLANKKRRKNNQRRKKATGKITHTWDTFTRFEEFQLGEAPITVSQIPAALEKVKQKLGEFQTKSVQEKTRILKEIEEEEKKDRELELENKKNHLKERKKKKKSNNKRKKMT